MYWLQAQAVQTAPAATMAAAAVKERGRAAILGALVADAATMPLHCEPVGTCCVWSACPETKVFGAMERGWRGCYYG